MKLSELLGSLPEWKKATPDQLCASPAFAMPCRLGETACSLHLDAIRPAETLDILVRFENETHRIGLCDTPRFPDLHALWPSRDTVPEPILLALIERECGPLFQMLENAVRRQLVVEGIARTPDDRPTLAASVIAADGQDPLIFTLTRSNMILEAFGSLRFIDATHPAIRNRTLPVAVEYAAFTLSAADLAGLAPGDALILPEIDPGAATWPVKVIADGRFAATAETGVTPWSDPETLMRVVRADDASVTFGVLADLAADPSTWETPDGFARFGKPKPNTPLTLLRAGKVIASGRLDRLGAQNAMVIDALAGGGNP